MATNQYFNSYAAPNEQSLTNDLIVEAIQAKGVDVKYMPRTHNNFDFLYGEDPTSSFNSCVAIEMYPAEVNGFGGQGELMSKFGLEIKETATFIVSKTRFKEEFPDFIRPREGDLIFMPFANSILEIKFVGNESPFFQQGQVYVWELKVETFELSQENIATGDTEVDGIIADIFNFNAATQTEPYGDNKSLEEEYGPLTTFDPNNPFGVD